MRHRIGLIAIIALSLLGASVVSAQDGTTVAGQPDELVVVSTIPYGESDYEIAAGDGPVLAYVDAVIETEAGVEVVGTLLVHDRTGWRVAGPWVDPAPSDYAAAIPGDILTLALPEPLGATE